jgi:hypothetical protein
MACKDVGRLFVGASQFGTTAQQVFELPASVATSAAEVVQAGMGRDWGDPFYASRPDVAGKRRALDTTPFVETTVPLTHVINAGFEEPIRQRRIVVMKKRG